MTAAKPLVSVCMPCHNAGRYVASAVESVLRQTWPHIELIVVNDGSTDDSERVLGALSDARLRVVHEQFGSAARARNRAFQESRGEYVKYFDADDLMNTTCIESQMHRLAGHKNAVAVAGWGRFYGDDLDSFKPNPQSVWRDMSGLDWLTESWIDAQPMMQPGMFLIPRSLHDAVGMWDESLTLTDDFEFFARVLCKADEVLFAPDAWLYYRSGLAGSLSSRVGRAAAESAFQSLSAGTRHLLLQRTDAQARMACANMMQGFVYTFYPQYGDLTARAVLQVASLGGSTLPPTGPPRFQQLRRLIGWKLARRVQRLTGR